MSAAMLICAAAAAEVALAKINVNMEAQPIREALRAFGEQSGLQILFRSETTSMEGVTTPRVTGELPVREALEQLLSTSTDLEYEFVNERTVRITSRQQRQGAAQRTGREIRRVPGRFRLAQAANDAQGSQRSDAEEEGIERSIPEGRQSELEEIVVTAQKRREDIIDVPISISTLSAQELAALRAEGAESYIKTIPNASFSTAEGRLYPSITLRGVSADLGGRFSPIGVTVDEVPYSTVDSAMILNARSLDLERIELLRGPQGTLTGANSAGGTLNLITVKPDPSGFFAEGELDYGRYQSWLARLKLNTPLSETLALRTVLFTEQGDGAVKNVVTGNSSSTDNYGGRLALRWLPTEDFTLDVTYGYSEQHYGGDNILYLNRFFSEEERANAIAGLPALGIPFDDPQTPFFEDAGNDGGAIRDDLDSTNDLELWFASLHAAYELGPYTAELIYGHFDSYHEGIATDVLPVSEWFDPFSVDSGADSIELRVSSSYEGPFNWVAGASYHQESVDELRVDARLGDVTFGGSYDDLWFKFRSLEELESYSVFSNVFWDIAERWRLSAGVRASRVRSTYGSSFFFPDGSEPDPIAIPLDPIVRVSGSTDEVHPRVALTFELTDSSNVYVQAASGYRAGYANDRRITGPQLTSRDPGVLFNVPQIVEGETIKNYELGFKGRLFDDRLSLAAAVFHMDFSDLQVFGGVIENPTPGAFAAPFDLNAGSATIDGFELEASARVTERLELRAGVGHVDTRIEELNGERLSATDPASEILGLPFWNGSAALIYEQPLTGNLKANFRADYTWAEEYFGDPLHSELLFNPGFDLVNLSIGLSGRRWTATAYFENVFDDLYWLSTDQLTLNSLRYGAYFVPRTYGVRFTARFGAD